MKKVLLLTISNGDSYNMVARAIANGFATRYSSVTFKICDIFKINKSMEFNFGSESTLSEKLAHKIENDRYVKAKYTHSLDKKRKIIEKYIIPAQSYVEKIINTYEPDIVMCTHIFPAVIVNDLIKENNFNFKSIYIAADYTTSPFLDLAKDLDMYIVNSKDMFREYLKVGISKDKCNILGVPLVPKFDHPTQRSEARELLHLDEDKYTILLTNGTKKRDNNFKLFKAIVNKFDDSDILVVCNKNANLQNKIKNYVKSNNLQNVKVFGHTNHIDMLITASDVVLGKTSGEEIAQALALKTPYVATLKIRGQELDNMKFLKANSLILNARTIKDLISRVQELKDNKRMQKLYRDKMAKFYIANATDELVKIAFHMQKD